MNLKIVAIAGLLSFTAVMQSCKGTKDAVSSDAKQVQIVLADNGKTFTVKPNEKFQATFNECVGCAQVWKITAIDNAKIETLPNTYSNKSCTNCVGGNQDNTFHFQAKAAGKSDITFSYFDKTVTVTIDAK